MSRPWTRVTSQERDPKRALAALKKTFPRMRTLERVQAAGRLSAGLPIVVRQRVIAAPGALHLEPASGPLLPLSTPPHPGFTLAWTTLRELLGPRAPGAFEDLEGPALEEDVAMVEARLGRPLPGELKSLLSLHDGQRADGPLPWELAPLHERLMTWQWLNRCGFPLDWWNPDWFPVLSNGRGDYRVLDLSQPEPPLIEYRHDAPARPWVASSLSSWIRQVHAALQAGQLFGTTVDGRFAGLTAILPTEDEVDVLLFTDES
jgi:cell wall assembly regulator SMI1